MMMMMMMIAFNKDKFHAHGKRNGRNAESVDSGRNRLKLVEFFRISKALSAIPWEKFFFSKQYLGITYTARVPLDGLLSFSVCGKFRTNKRPLLKEAD